MEERRPDGDLSRLLAIASTIVEEFAVESDERGLVVLPLLIVWEGWAAVDSCWFQCWVNRGNRVVDMWAGVVAPGGKR